MNYLDFELEVNLIGGREYEVSVRSPAGEARQRLRFPFDDLTLESRLKDLKIALLHSGGQRRRVPSPEEKAVQSFGLELFNALIANEVRARYDVSKSLAAKADKGLRLILRLLDPKMAALPWEFLYDPRKAEYVCLSSSTPIVRYPDLAHPVQPLTVKPPLRILGMTVSPSDLNHLDIEREKQRVQQAVERLQGLITLTWLEGQTWEDIQDAMQGGPWHIFHFIGHGGFNRLNDEGLIALADEDGRTFELSATKLARLLDHRHLKLVLLNACEGARGGNLDIFSSTASILVRKGIPAVLAMQYEITDAAAIEFSCSFYKAVARGMALETAVSEARKAISVAVNNTIEWGTPVLYLRAQNGHLFDVALRQEQIEAIYNDAKNAVSNEDWDAAIEKLTVVLDGDTPNQEAQSIFNHAVEQRKISELYATGLRHYDAGRWSDALEIFAQIKERASDYKNVNALIFNAQSELRDEEKRQLQADIGQLYLEANEAISSHDWAVAVENLLAILNLDPTDAKAAAKLKEVEQQQRLEMLYVQAQRKYESGQWQEALEALRRVSEINGDYKDTKGLISNSLHELEKLRNEERKQAHLKSLLSALEEAIKKSDWAKASELLQAAPKGSADMEVIKYRQLIVQGQEKEKLERKALEKKEREATPPLAGIESSLDVPLSPPQVPPSPVEEIPTTPVRTRRTRRLRFVIVALISLLSIVAAIAFWTFKQGAKPAPADGRPTPTQTPTPLPSESTPRELSLNLEMLGELSSEHNLNRFAFSPDGQLVAAVGDKSEVLLWRTEDLNAPPILKGAPQSSRSVAISPDGLIVASGKDDGKIYLWRIGDGNALKPLEGHSEFVFNVSFSSDGQTLTSISGDKTIRRWSVSDGKELVYVQLPQRQAVVAISPDQRTVALYITDTREKQKIHLWSLDEQRTLMPLEQRAQVSCGAFSADGSILAIGSIEGTVRLWRVSDGSLLTSVEVMKGIPSSVTFSPDREVVATGWRDGVIRLWRVSDRSLLKEWKWAQDAVSNLSFSKDGKMFAASGGQKIGLWRVGGS